MSPSHEEPNSPDVIGTLDGWRMYYLEGTVLRDVGCRLVAARPVQVYLSALSASLRRFRADEPRRFSVLSG